MKIISWNVNGIRAVEKKGFLPFIEAEQPDTLCLQETKAHDHQLEETLLKVPGYACYFHSGDRKGYSGTAVYYKHEPLCIQTGLSDPVFNSEGRTIIMEYPDFVLYNVYFPNGQKDDERLQFKMAFNHCLQQDVKTLLEAGKNVIVCGDINTAHREIDLKNPRENAKRSGFLPIERAWIDEFLALGMIDIWRAQHPDEIKYSWWSYRFNARKNNAGWRIDSFYVSKNFADQVAATDILNDVPGSDHCPIVLTLK